MVLARDERGLVGANLHTALPSLTGSGVGDGEFETTFQSAGAVTVNVKGALRSGCSNVVYTRRASGTSNCE